MKFLVSGICLLMIIIWGCSKDPASVNSNSVGKGSASIHLVSDSGSAFDSLAKSAYVVVHASGMDTVRQSLTVGAHSVTGTISNISAGPNRIFDVFVLGTGNAVCYFGEGNATVIPGATVTVKLTIYRSDNGSAVIEGRIVDSLPTPQCFVLDTQFFGKIIQIRKVCNGDTIFITDSNGIDTGCVVVDSTPLNSNAYRIVKNCHGFIIIDTIIISELYPVVTITFPDTSSTFHVGDTIPITAFMSNLGNHTVTRVLFYADSILIGQDSLPPYSINRVLPPGFHTIIAKGIFDNALMIPSWPVFVLVQGPPNKLPFVTITSPKNNATFRSTDNIVLSADAHDSDGVIQNVVFYRDDSTYVGVDSIAPYSLTTKNLKIGTHTFWASTTDNSGAVNRSQLITIKVR